MKQMSCRWFETRWRLYSVNVTCEINKWITYPDGRLKANTTIRNRCTYLSGYIVFGNQTWSLWCCNLSKKNNFTWFIHFYFSFSDFKKSFWSDAIFEMAHEISGDLSALPLRWRHNGRDGVSNHQPHDCLLNRLFRPRSKRTSKFRVTGFCVGNSPDADNVPFHNVIMPCSSMVKRINTVFVKI